MGHEIETFLKDVEHTDPPRDSVACLCAPLQEVCHDLNESSAVPLIDGPVATTCSCVGQCGPVSIQFFLDTAITTANNETEGNRGKPFVQQCLADASLWTHRPLTRQRALRVVK